LFRKKTEKRENLPYKGATEGGGGEAGAIGKALISGQGVAPLPSKRRCFREGLRERNRGRVLKSLKGGIAGGGGAPRNHAFSSS